MTTQKSVSIANSAAYAFNLKLDDINGIIRLSKNISKKQTMQITDRLVPIGEATKIMFTKDRTGYSEHPTEKYKFIGSYIDRQLSPIEYASWKDYIITRYKALKADAIQA